MTYDSIGDIPIDELDDYMEHFGVKGMKWGVRKARDSRADIKNARARNRLRKAEVKKYDAQRISATTSKGRSAAEKALAKAQADLKNSPDYRKSKKFTVLEIAGAGAVSGTVLPVVGGVIVMGGMVYRNRQLNRPPNDS